MINLKSNARRRRYYQVLLFRRDLEIIINLFVSSCEDVEMWIDNVPVMPGEGCLPLENQRIRSFFIKGYEDTGIAPRTGERRQSVQLKITSWSAVITMSDKSSRPLWEVGLQTGKLLSSKAQNTFFSLLLRLICFIVLGNEAILAYVFQTSHTLIHVALDILLIALWLVFGVWGLKTTNWIYLVNMDARRIARKIKRKAALKIIPVVIGAVLIAALVIWLKGLVIP